MYRRILACVLATSVAGCSLAMVKGPAEPPEDPPSCDEDAASPYIDMAWALLFGITTLAFVAEGGDDYEGADNSDEYTAGAVSAVGAIGFGVSSFIGFGRMESCRRVLDDHERRQQYTMPPPMQMPPVMQPPPPMQQPPPMQAPPIQQAPPPMQAPPIQQPTPQQ